MISSKGKQNWSDLKVQKIYKKPWVVELEKQKPPQYTLILTKIRTIRFQWEVIKIQEGQMLAFGELPIKHPKDCFLSFGVSSELLYVAIRLVWCTGL